MNPKWRGLSSNVFIAHYITWYCSCSCICCCCCCCCCCCYTCYAIVAGQKRKDQEAVALSYCLHLNMAHSYDMPTRCTKPETISIRAFSSSPSSSHSSSSSNSANCSPCALFVQLDQHFSHLHSSLVFRLAHLIRLTSFRTPLASLHTHHAHALSPMCTLDAANYTTPCFALSHSPSCSVGTRHFKAHDHLRL